ncbi:MAG: hypothetical protein ACYTG0_23670 [Planctomycetota bacterium]
MNTRQFVFTFLVVAIGAGSVVPALGGETALSDNAALQYWKAFAVLPEFSDEQNDAMHDALEQGTMDKPLQKMIESSGSALGELRKGARLKACAWGVSLEEGPHAILPHLSKARQLSRVACLRAEAYFQQGKAAEATDDVAAVMTLARHIGEDGVLISLLVDYAVEGIAINTIAANLPSLDAGQLQALGRKIEALPPLPTVADAIIAEKEMFLGWVIRVLSQPDGKKRLIALFGSAQSEDAKKIRKHSREELLAAAKQLQGFYDQMAEALALPPDEAKQAAKRLTADPGVEGPARELAAGLAPALGAARSTEAVHQTRLALLKAAVAVRQHGPDVLQKDAYRDPFGTGPFQYTETKNGFKLESTLTDAQHQPVTLTAGRP